MAVARAELATLATAVACLLAVLALVQRRGPARVAGELPAVGDRAMAVDLTAEAAPPREALEAFAACAERCKARTLVGDAWARGPCLDEDLGGWGCDVAHCPRQPVDEDPKNQCHRARWVELDADCRWLRYRAAADEPRRGILCEDSGKALRLDVGVLPDFKAP